MGRQRSADRVRLRLYVAGSAPCSVAARANLRALLDELNLKQATLEVVDVFERPHEALRDRVLVTPMLLRLEPLPVTRVVGTLEDTSLVRTLLTREESAR